jgi:peptide/nickel transport system substrate-binding protein
MFWAKNVFRLVFASLLVLTVGLIRITTAQENCVKVAGIESSGELLNLDPINQPSTQNSILVGVMYNRLMDLSSTFEVSPELAEKWETNASGDEWTFYLRKGVKFHDGKDLTAKDVVYTYKRLIDPKSGSEAAATLAFLAADGITAADDYTVVFKTPKPVVELPVLITNKNTFIVPDGATTDSIKATPNGTGPFIPVDFDPAAQSHVFKKNSSYWEAGRPKSDCVEFFVVQEPTTLSASLLSGEIDVAQQVSYSTIPSLKDKPEVQLLTAGPATQMTMAMWVDTPPFDDNRVRTAMKKVIDRKAMLQTVLLGYGYIGDDNPVPPQSPFAWRPESDVPGPDIEGAKKLLADAGYTADKPLKVDLYTSEYIPGAVAMAQVYKEQAAQAGIEVNLVIGNAKDHWDNVWLKYSFVGSGWNARHPGEGLAIAHRSNAQYPETHWKRDDFDKFLDSANTEADAAKRKALYQSAEKLLTDEGGSLIPLFQQIVSGVRQECSGYEPRAQLYRVDLRDVACTK